MKRYRFSLESALRVRLVQEEAARFALAHANAELQRATTRYRRALARYDRLEPGGGEQDLESFRRGRDQAERLAASAHAAWLAVDAATDEAAARHQDWVTASRRVTALQKLDDRRRGEWQVEEQRAEAAANDESALSRWRARSVESATDGSGVPA